MPESRVDEYRSEAARCREQAEKAVNETIRSEWLRLAADWERMAEEAEREIRWT